MDGPVSLVSWTADTKYKEYSCVYVDANLQGDELDLDRSISRHKIHKGVEETARAKHEICCQIQFNAGFGKWARKKYELTPKNVWFQMDLNAAFIEFQALARLGQM